MTLLERILMLIAFLLALSLLVLLPVDRQIDQLVDEHALRVPEDFSSIQLAIDAAQPGDHILINASRGPYHGALLIETPGITLISQNGRAVINTQDGSLQAVRILADNVKLMGFEVQTTYMGIHVEDASGVEITDNIVRDTLGMAVVLIDVQESLISNNISERNFHGIWVSGSSHNNVIRDNTIRDQSGVGIALSLSHETEILENNVTGNRMIGIELLGSSRNVVRGNRIVNNKGVGINLEESANANIIVANVIEGNQHGIWLLASHDNMIRENAIRGQSLNGIELNSSGNSQLTLNEISSNTTALRMANAGGSRVWKNEISMNQIGMQIVGFGASVEISNNNIIQNVEVGLENQTEDEIVAIENYWGSANGPSREGVRIEGDLILGPVQFEPWAQEAIQITP